MALLMTALKRSANGGYSARKGIPKDVRSEYQRLYGAGWEAKFSAPPNAKLHEAKARFAEWLSEIETRIATLRAAKKGEGRPLTKLNAIALAGEWYVWFVAKHQQGDHTAHHWSTLSDVFADLLMEEAPSGFNELGPYERDWSWMGAPEVRAKLRPLVAEEAQTALFLAHRGIVLNDEAHELFLDNVEDNFGDAFDILARRAQGDYTPDKKLKTFPAFEDHKESSGSFGSWALFEAWVLAAKPAASTVSRWRAVFLGLDAYFPDKSVDQITAKDAKTWISSLVTEKRSASTVSDVWLGASKRVFGWGVEQEHIRSNPFAAIKVTVPKVTRERETKAFTIDEAKLILREASKLTAPVSTFQFVQRWVPWLCAYTGARVGEITQLRATDILKEGDVYFAKLTPSAGTIKTSVARSVPLHEHLMAQGFMLFIESRGEGPLFYNAVENEEPVDALNPRRSRAVKARERLAEWVRKIGVTDPELSPNHAWRHTFKAQADRVGISEKISDAITGHAPASVGRGYGQPTIADMARALEKFPRYSLD